MVKKIAVYGAYETKEPVRQRYWKRRKDGIKQRYWKKTTRMKKVVKKGRFEFHARAQHGDDLTIPNFSKNEEDNNRDEGKNTAH